MPIYIYQCEKCGQSFDLLEGMTAVKTKRKCPECGSIRIKKAHAAFSVGSSGCGSDSFSCPSCPSGPSPCSSGSCPMG